MTRLEMVIDDDHGFVFEYTHMIISVFLHRCSIPVCKVPWCNVTLLVFVLRICKAVVLYGVLELFSSCVGACASCHDIHVQHQR